MSGSYDQVTESKELPLFSHALKELWSDTLPAISIETFAQSPAGAGIGGSSSLLVGLCAALFRMRSLINEDPEPTKEALVNIVRDIETGIIKVPAGCQDYWGAMNGGINIIDFPAGGEKCTNLSSEWIQNQGIDLLLCYSGVSRKSGINNWDIFKRAFDGDSQILNRLQEICDISSGVSRSVIARDFNSALKGSNKEWEMRKSLWPAIETPETKKICQSAIESGASLTRVCGAGGGGVLAIFVETSLREKVSEAISKSGGEILSAGISETGLVVEHSN